MYDTHTHPPPRSEAEVNQFHTERVTAGPINICSMPTITKPYCCHIESPILEYTIHSFTLMVFPNHSNRTCTSPYGVILFSIQDYFTLINNIRYEPFLLLSNILIMFSPVRFCYGKS